MAKLADLVDAGAGPGTISIYGGQQPASAHDPVGNSPLLTRLAFAKPAFGAPARGEIGARLIPDGEAVAAGKPTWVRISDCDGNTIVDIDVGEGGKPLNLSAVVLQQGDRIPINALVLRLPAI